MLLNSLPLARVPSLRQKAPALGCARTVRKRVIVIGTALKKGFCVGECGLKRTVPDELDRSKTCHTWTVVRISTADVARPFTPTKSAPRSDVPERFESRGSRSERTLLAQWRSANKEKKCVSVLKTLKRVLFGVSGPFSPPLKRWVCGKTHRSCKSDPLAEHHCAPSVRGYRAWTNGFFRGCVFITSRRKALRPTSVFIPFFGGIST
jgi:hypothetical protein